MKNNVGNWIQSSANIGILLGLVFVGFQMQQDKELKRADLVFANLESFFHQNNTILGDASAETFAKAAMTPDELTDADIVILLNYFDSRLLQWNQWQILEDSGLIGPEWQALSDLPWEFGTEVGNRFARQYVLPSESLPADFREKLKRQLETDRQPDSFRALITSLKPQNLE